MADLKVRQLDDEVAKALKTRADRRGVSLEEEVRTALSGVVTSRARAFARRAAAIRRSAAKPGSARLDSARLIRQERDRRG